MKMNIITKTIESVICVSTYVHIELPLYISIAYSVLPFFYFQNKNPA